MVNLRVLLKLFDRDFVVRLLLLVLLYSLVPIAETLLLEYVGSLLGNYLTLAVAASTGLLMLPVALKEFHSRLNALKTKARNGTYPLTEFMALGGVLIGAILILTPGFITDVIGFLFFFPPLRNWVGIAVTRALHLNLKELYEYLKLYDL